MALGTAAMGSEQAMQQAMSEWTQQIAEYQAALSLATTEEQRAELPPPTPEEVAPKIWRSVSKAVKTQGGGKKGATTYEFDEEWAAPAVIWLVQHPEAFAKALEDRPKELPRYAKAIMNSLLNTHYKNPLIAEACPKLAESSGDLSYKILKRIYAENPDATAKGCAALALSLMLSNPTLMHEEGGEAGARRKRVFYIMEALNTAPGNAMFGTASLTQVATEEIYRLRNLSIGSIPPRITLSDKDGQPAVFPQSGKPNLIFFWSPGEEVGLSLMSKQNALAKQYPDLIICPIIPYGDRDDMVSMMQANDMQSCYQDDVQGTAGSAYRVAQLPHAVLVDERARVLYIGYPDMRLQTALANYFSNRGKAAPAQKPATPAPRQDTPRGSNEPPTLREMPKF